MSDSPAAPQSPGNRSSPTGAKASRVVRMGKYEVVRHIATGGMGAVYRAWDTEANRDVALKVLQPALAVKPNMLERFRREARSAQKLNHENIVRLYEFGEVSGTHFLVMEFVDGIDLHEHIKQHGPFDPEAARQIVLQSARALRHAHEQNIVHRDIKPSNFLLTHDNSRPRVKLADFGLAMELDTDDHRVTRAGTTVGTVDYMAPEQARDSGSADIRSDLYSLGSTWYHLLTGHAPFPEGGLGERLIKIMHEEPPDIRDIEPTVSAECWDVMLRLLAKEPEDRYQNPAELIADLHALEGRAVAEDRPRSARVGKKRPARDTDTSPTAGTVTVPTANDRRLWYALGSVAAAVLLAVVALVATTRRSLPPDDLPDVPQPIAAVDPPAPHSLAPPLPPPDRTPVVRTIPPEKLKVPALPLLTTAVKSVKAAQLRQEVEKPWSEAKPFAAGGEVFRVGRGETPSATRFRGIAEALAKAPAGKSVVVEIHDNGPLFEPTLGSIAARDVVLRAARGYRPLVVWDIPAHAAQKPGKPSEPLTFLAVAKGRLLVEGVEFAWRWPENLERPAVLFDAEDSDLSVTDCAVSAAGKPGAALVLGRLRATRPGVLCRWTRCLARGAGVVALDINAPRAEVLVDGCLLVGGHNPLLRVQSPAAGPNLRVVRSTLVCAANLLELKPAGPDKNPTLAWLGWDSLFSRSCVEAGGALFALENGATTQNMQWRAVNCLYAGFRHLQTGTSSVEDDIGDWHRHWGRIESDGLVRTVWPEQVYNEPANQPALSYDPEPAVRFASSVALDQPLGCHLAALTPACDNWVALAFEPAAAAPDFLEDDATPEIPVLDDKKFHGAEIDLDDVDLGDYLSRVQQRCKFGPKVVLHLRGKGPQRTSPIRVKGSTLVLHFAEPADKDTPRLELVFSRSARAVPLIDVEGGGLDIIGGVLRIPDISSLRASHLIRVTHGDVRLFRTRLEGPQQTVPEGYVAALAVAGSGDLTLEKAQVCALNECAIVSSQAGIVLSGVGCRLGLRQSLVVAGTEGLVVQPGTQCKGRTGISACLKNTTFACRRAVVRLHNAGGVGRPADPVVIDSRACAYLNPFAGQPNKAGLLLCEGDALARGLLLWQGERDAYDPRLFFTAAGALDALPAAREKLGDWVALWGSAGVRQARTLQPQNLAGVFDPRRWLFDRLVLRGPNMPGASIDRLGVLPRRKN